MAKELDSKRSVYNFYGPRTRLEGNLGEVRTAGTIKEMVLEFKGDTYSFVSGKLPASAKPLRFILNVESAFTLTGTTPALQVGTSGSEATNGFTLSEANLEAAGTYVSTSFNGTWGSELAAATTVAIVLSGTGSPTIAASGNARVILEYVLIEA